MDIAALARQAAPIIIAQFQDLCDLTKVVRKNIDGQMIPDPVASVTVLNVPCAYEPLQRSAQSQNTSYSEIVSSEVTHKLLLEETAATMGIDAEYEITVHPRGDVGQLVFEQPVRMDESLSPLVVVSASLRNQ